MIALFLYLFVFLVPLALTQAEFETIAPIFFSLASLLPFAGCPGHSWDPCTANYDLGRPCFPEGPEKIGGSISRPPRLVRSSSLLRFFSSATAKAGETFEISE